MFVNTRYFSPVIMEGLTQAPKGSYEWHEYWDIQNDRCLNGYEVGGVKITGRHYHYLNFWPIRRDEKGRGKRVGPPRFLDMDFEFYWEVEKCILTGKDLLVLKRRQAGFSYKSSQIVGYEFTFVPDSNSLITSGEEKYSVNTMRFVKAGLDHAANTEFYKARSPDSSDFFRASYKEVDEYGIEHIMGMLSTVERRTASSEQATVGLSPSLKLYEEIGKYKNIKAVKAYMDPAMEEMGKKTGFQLMIGTGGESNTSIDEVGEMFYNPERYGLMSYENTFEDQIMDDVPTRKLNRIAYFVPGDYFTKVTDEDGNSHREKAREVLMERRAKLEGDKENLLKEITQFPLTPEEALMVPNGNVFPIGLLLKRRSELLKYAEHRDRVRSVRIDWLKDSHGNVIGAEWVDDELNGAFRMSEPPFKEPNNKVPIGLYIAGVDSYDKDTAADPERASFGACTVYKLFNQVSDPIDNTPVCKLIQRPETSKEFYENVAKMCVLYGYAQAMIEYSNILIFDWLRTHGFGGLIKGRPRIAYANMANSNVQNRDGIDPNTKYVWEQMAADELKNGGAERLLDLELVDKLIKYRSDVNCDESISYMLCILAKNDIISSVREEVKEEPFTLRRYVVKNGKMVRL
jgi:hypothetical protein